MAKFASLLWLAAAALATSHRRALPANTPNGYTPVLEDCPSERPSVRRANGLSNAESEWLRVRRNATINPMTSFLGSLNISGFDAAAYVRNQSSNIENLPNIAIAFSGGGYRSMLTGAGAIKVFDSREPNANLGGLLQSSTYVAGLSGGGWLVGSVFVNNFTRISDLQSSTGQLWNFTNTIFEGPDGTEPGQLDYYNTLGMQVMNRRRAGFGTSITDFWGRTLSFQFVNASLGGPDYTWSSIRDQPGFSTGDIPFPLVVAVGRVNNQTQFPASNSTVYEFGPFELGSWDPSTYGFVDLKFVGSNFTNGTLPNNEQCVRGYDNVGLVIGTTSSIFTPLAGTLVATQIPKEAQGALGDVIQQTEEDQGFVANFRPNPFQDWNPTGRNEDSEFDTLYLVDGGTDNQNIPYQPLIQSARAVDVIVTVDASNDIIGYPNGAAIGTTYNRSVSSTQANGTTFPPVPDTNTFINLGLNNQPTFFGCNATKEPLIVYIPNAPYISFSNVSTFDLDFTYAERDALINNGALVATQGNGTANREFRACLGCAILARSFSRTRTTVPAACQTCFNAYCWNGTTASNTPTRPYAPSLIGASPNGRNLNVTGSPSGNGSNTGNGGSNTGAASHLDVSTWIPLSIMSMAALLWL